MCGDPLSNFAVMDSLFVMFSDITFFILTRWKLLPQLLSRLSEPDFRHQHLLSHAFCVYHGIGQYH